MYFANTGLIRKEQNYLLYVVFSRLTLGLAASTIYAVCFDVTSRPMYKKHQVKFLTTIGASSSLGYLLAPVIGSALYASAGYNAPFVYFANLYLFVALILRCIISDKIEPRQVDTFFDLGSLHVIEGKPTVGTLMSKPYVLYSCLAGAMNILVFSQ